MDAIFKMRVLFEVAIFFFFGCHAKSMFGISQHLENRSLEFTDVDKFP